MRNSLPDHLGRSCDNNFSAIDIPVIDYFCKGKKTFLDIGCANGEAAQYVQCIGLDAYGIDGDPYAIYEYSDKLIRDKLICHDYTIGKSSFNIEVDIVWSMDFVEHVKEIYIDNFMKDFCLGKIIILNTPPKGSKGHHHVNTQNKNYWINLFTKYGYFYSKSDSMIAEELSDYYNPVHGEWIKKYMESPPKQNYMVFHVHSN
jgi:cyclopropane fatty-acyl-phospholipid synthase-like methyltransferase